MSNLGFRLLYHLLNDRPGDRVRARVPALAGHGGHAAGARAAALHARVPRGGARLRRARRDAPVRARLHERARAARPLRDPAPRPRARRRRPAGRSAAGPAPTTPSRWPTSSTRSRWVTARRSSLEIADAVAASGFRRGGATRRELLERLAHIPGVYVPAFFAPRYDPISRALVAIEPLRPGYEKVERRVMPDLNALPTTAYTRPLVPFMQTVHDRLPIEIQRGCTRGCRFCQVGMITRPTRAARSEAGPPPGRDRAQGLRLRGGGPALALLRRLRPAERAARRLPGPLGGRADRDEPAVAPDRDHERGAGRQDRPHPEDRVHPRPRGGHRADARGDQQGQPRGGPPRARSSRSSRTAGRS